jgi:hypothetical protein
MKKIAILTLFLVSIALSSYSQDTSKVKPSPKKVKSIPSDTEVYKSQWVLHTSFNLPVLIATPTSKENSNNSKVNLSLFNSLGAGFTLAYGEFKEDSKNNETEEFINRFGLSLGCLFSINNAENSTSNTKFAPFIGLSILDFQVGYGYELGTLVSGSTRSLITIGYNIPITKLGPKSSYRLGSIKGRTDCSKLYKSF